MLQLEETETLYEPKIILLLSGKRKCGKDYITNVLCERIGTDKCSVIRISGPLKERYAAENDLDYEKLLDASEYKELHRLKMIRWGEDIRAKDPNYFCKHAVQQTNTASKQVWIISDIRRQSDIDYFEKSYPEITYKIQVQACEKARLARGWKFTSGVDDCESECNLDDFHRWDCVLKNDGDEELLNECLEKVMVLINIIVNHS